MSEAGIFVNVEFERRMIQLASLTGYDIHLLVQAFNQWYLSTVFPWPVALDYCLDRARTGKSLPFTIETEQ